MRVGVETPAEETLAAMLVLAQPLEQILELNPACEVQGFRGLGPGFEVKGFRVEAFGG